MRLSREWFLLQVFFVLIGISIADVFDVTTVCRYGIETPETATSPAVYNDKLSIDIRARNNALGLPFFVYNNTPVEPNVGVSIDQCTPQLGECIWNNVGQYFEALPADIYSPLLPSSVQESQQIYLSCNMTTKYRFYNEIDFEFSTTDSYGVLGVLLMDSRADPLSSDLYYIRLQNGKNGNSDILKCTSFGTEEYKILNKGKRNCKSYESKKLENNMWGKGYRQPYSNQKYSFNVSFSNGRLLVNVGWSDKEMMFLNWTDTDPIEVQYYIVLTDNLYGHVLLQGEAPKVWTLTGYEGTFRSPWFVPKYNKICVAVTDFKHPKIDLHLSVHSSDWKKKLNFVPTHTNEITEGWENTRFLVELPEDMQHDNVTVLLTARDTSEIKSRTLRIVSCNGQDEGLQELEEGWAISGGARTLRSPSFAPESNEICVVLTHFKNPKINLQLSVLDSDGNKMDFVPMQTSNITEGWEDMRFRVELPDNMQQDNVTVVLTTRDPSESKYLIQRIAGCNGEDEEDILELVHEKVVKLPEYGYDVAVNVRPSSTTTNTSLPVCKNDGQLDSQTGFCICPAGFTGSNCQTGCGKNSYGSTCDARCSTTTRGCQGMKFCRPNMPCMCAPGLNGHYCDIPCKPGDYGVECKQKCGSCKNSHCDPYTGLCSKGCDTGYIPPYCKETYQYVSVAPKVTTGFTSLTATTTLEDTVHGISTEFYQFQYRKSKTLKMVEEPWIGVEMKPVTTQEIVTSITGLEPATHYEVRIVLIDTDGSSYQGSLVPTADVRTKCVVPDDALYYLKLVRVTERSLQISWNYSSLTEFACPVSHFVVELKEHSRWVAHSNVKDMAFELDNLLPGQQYSIRVRAITLDGPTSYSNVLSARTRDEAPWNVFNYELVSTTENEIHVRWSPPLVTAGNIINYRVTYQCLKLLSCETKNCSYDKGQVEDKSNSVVLRGLLSHAQYSVSVAALAANWGPTTHLRATTKMGEPGVAPGASSNPVLHKTNTSFTVQWEPPEDCTYINGYLHGYRYQLLYGNSLIQEGKTRHRNAGFQGLTPRGHYTVKIFLDTTKGWSANHPLVIPVVTLATTPGPVQKLTVYKRGRRMLGFRWAAPNLTYGDIESFTVSYVSHLGTESTIMKPIPCAAWPNLYCHSFKNLRADTNYTILVRARNVEIPADGEETAVSAFTRESPPEAPSSIRIVSQGETDITVEWGLPNMLNGVLRSFLVDVEGTDSFNSIDCCPYIPVQEVVVRSEQASYDLQISNLQPASTYTIGVTAKTIGLGPAINTTVNTRPPVPPMENLVQLPDISDGLSSATPTVVIHRSAVYDELIRDYLVIVLPQETETNFNSTIWDPWLSQEMNRLTNGSFYIAAEIEQSDLKTTIDFKIGKNDEKVGKWGVVQNPELENGTFYRIGLAAVLEYCGALNVGYSETDVFQVIDSST